MQVENINTNTNTKTITTIDSVSNSDDENSENIVEIKEFVLAFVIFTIGFFGTLFLTKNNKDAIKFLSNKVFIISFLTILFFSYYVFFIIKAETKHVKKLRVAAKHAFIAYIIALFSRLDSFVISTFAMVFLVSYFLHTC